LQEVERRALGGEQAARRAGQFAQERAGGGLFALGHLPVASDGGIDLAQRFFKPSLTANNGSFARDHGGAADLLLRNQARGPVGFADVFRERGGDIGGDDVAGWQGKGHG